MFVVIFEAEPAPSQQPRYLELAAELKLLLKDIDGFISIERFQSLSQPEKILSISWWRDERAIQSWRRQMAHRAAQREGRSQIFSHYRLRVTQVIRDYSLVDRAQAPHDD